MELLIQRIADVSELSRRQLLGTGGAAAAAAALGTVGAAEALAAQGGNAPHPKTPAEALKILQAGNKRYRQE